MSKYIYSGVFSLLLLGAVLVPNVNAETITPATTTPSSIEAMVAQIKILMARVVELQKQLGLIKGEIKTTLKDGLAEGMTSDDIRKVQELLATDPVIYPEGMVTGFYGKLTTEALKRFQMRHDLEVTGTMSAETKDLLEEYLHEGFGNKIPEGLLRAPGIMKKVEDRFSQGCESHGHGMGPLCKKLRSASSTEDSSSDKEDKNDDKNNESENHGSNDGTATSTFNVVIDIVSGTTTVSFTSSSTDYEVVVHSTNKSEVLSEVAKKLGLSVDALNNRLVKEIKNALEIAKEGV